MDQQEQLAFIAQELQRKRTEIHSLEGQLAFLKRKKAALPKGKVGSIYEANKRQEQGKKLDKEIENTETNLRRRRMELKALEIEDKDKRQLPLGL